MELTKAVANINKKYFAHTYFRWWKDSPNISIVLIAKKVPADNERKIASTNYPVEAINHPAPIAATFNKACPMINP